MRFYLKIFTLFTFFTLGNSSCPFAQNILCDGSLMNALTISTGLDKSGNLLSANNGNIDPYWFLTNLPTLNGCTDAEQQGLGVNAYVVNYNNSTPTNWTNQSDVGTLSPVNATNGLLSCSTLTEPFIFERYFCLEQSAEVEFSISFKGDNRLQLALVNLNTGREEQVSGTYVYQNPPLAPAVFEGALGLNAGQYALRAYYENSAGAGGFSVKGNLSVLSGDALLQNAILEPTFTCSSQDTLERDDYYFYPDSSLTICANEDLLPSGETYLYQWFAPDGSALQASPAMDQNCFTITSLTEKTVGTYYCQVQAPGSNLCYILPVKVGTYVQDPTGAWYIPNQLVVKYRNNVSEAQKQAYINSIQATRLDSCMCLLDLLMLPDTLYDENGDPIIDPEEKKKKAGSENNTGVETVGWNTIMEEEAFVGGEKAQEEEDWLPAAPTANNGDSVIVALIDTGFDYSEPSYSPYIWKNPDPYPVSTDSCRSCIVGAEIGYDFGDRDNDPTPLNPHGQFVGRSILYLASLLADPGSPKVKIMPLKVMDDKGEITVFSVTCATIFAVRHGAQVINYSMGGYGGYQEILEAGLNTVAPGNCAPAIVTSAGNDTIDISTVPHYFSNLRDSLPEVITINSYQTNPNDTYELAGYSNYGSNIDLTITGEALFDTYPYTGVKGTSISAGYISGILAYIYEQKPGISAASAISALQTLAAQNGGGLNLVSITGLYWKPQLDDILKALPDEGCTYMQQACIPIITATREEFRGRTPLEVEIIPNPNNGEWSFRFELEQTQQLQWYLFDLQGKMIEKNNLRLGPGVHRIPYSLGNHPDGIYFYQVISEKYIHAGKIIKQKH